VPGVAGLTTISKPLDKAGAISQNADLARIPRRWPDRGEGPASCLDHHPGPF
jgi:hypothetical protein